MSLRRVGHALWATAMITVLAADPAAAQGAGQGRGAQAPEAVEGRFLDVIVVLDPAFAPGGHAANRAEAARVARGLGVASPQFAYGTALFGFAARIPEGRLAALSNHPRVLFVDFDAPSPSRSRGRRHRPGARRSRPTRPANPMTAAGRIQRRWPARRFPGACSGSPPI